MDRSESVRRLAWLDEPAFGRVGQTARDELPTYSDLLLLVVVDDDTRSDGRLAIRMSGEPRLGVMRLVDAAGEPLDAEFDIEPASYGVDVVLHSRAGGRTAVAGRNVDYFSALELMLARFGSVEAWIRSVEVDSVVARQLPASERLIPLDYPIPLTNQSDMLALRRQITEGQRKVAYIGTSVQHRGNSHKRIRIRVDLRSTQLDLQGVLALLQVTHDPSAPSRTYRRATANPAVRSADLYTFDPAARERALSSHARIQNGLVDHLDRLGVVAFSPNVDEPSFDVAWLIGSELYVAEVKSMSGLNVANQLRLGLGQVLHYRTLLHASYDRVTAVLAVEHEPDPIWHVVCRDAGVRLTWPSTWPDVM